MKRFLVTVERLKDFKRFTRVICTNNAASAVHKAYTILAKEPDDYSVISTVECKV